MKVLDCNIYDYLEDNHELDLRCIIAFKIKEGTPQKKIDEIREYHNKEITNLEIRPIPYFVVDFFIEDFYKNIEIELWYGQAYRKDVLDYYRKKKSSNEYY